MFCFCFSKDSQIKEDVRKENPIDLPSLYIQLEEACKNKDEKIERIYEKILDLEKDPDKRIHKKIIEMENLHSIRYLFRKNRFFLFHYFFDQPVLSQNVVKCLIEEGADPNIGLYSVRNLSLETIKFLVESKGDVNCYDNAPVVTSIYNKFDPFGVLDYLISQNADVTAKNNKIIREAVFSENPEKIIRYAFSKGANYKDLNYTIFYNILLEKSKDKRVSALNCLLELKADVQAEDNLFIIEAAKMGDVSFFECLVKNGVNINFNMDNGKLLKFACIHREKEMMKYLMDKGVKMEEDYPSYYAKNFILRYKYFRKWRKIVFKNFIRKVITPLYYSLGFPGYLQGKKEIEKISENKLKIIIKIMF